MSGAAGPLPPDAFERLLVDAAAGSLTSLSPSSTVSLARYLSELDRWRRRTNLTGRLTAEDLARHVLEAVLGASSLPSVARLVDVGSGAGIPGIPLAIVAPVLDVTLLEPRGKRAEFLRHVVRAVPVENARVVQDRAENLPKASYDAATMRAVGDPGRVVANAPFLVPGGLLLLWTTRSKDDSLELGAFDRAESVADPASREKTISVWRKSK